MCCRCGSDVSMVYHRTGDLMKAQKTDLRTADGLVVYDLDPQASELWTVAGPDGVDPTTIDPDCLPNGFRWVTEYEWQSLQDTEEPTYGWRVITSANGTGLDGVVFATEQEAQKACEVCKKFSWEDTEFFVVKTTLEPTATFEEWHAQDWGVADDEQDDEPPMPTIMICNNFEWIRENCGVDFDGLDDETVRELVDSLTQDLSELLDCFKFKVEFPTDGKTTYHGWNGFRGFKHQFGICGTFDSLTDEQYDKVGELIQDSTDIIERLVDRIRSRTFHFKTDSESGTLCADSFDQACDKLRDMVPESAVKNGGWGKIWGPMLQRFVIGDVP